MSTIQAPGRTPRGRFLLFPFGTTHTDKYGPVEFDRADAIEVMHEHERRGRKLASDVEHAYHEPANKPAAWQDSHGWHGLEVDDKGLHAVADWNQNGAELLGARKVAYDSPAITMWRGNHVRSIEMISLVKDPARNGSIPLCMSNATGGATAQPSDKVKKIQRVHGALGELLAALNAGQGDQELGAISEQLATALIDPTARVNELLQQSGAATLKEEKQPADEGKVAETEPAKLMSAKADPLAELGAEVLTSMGVKTIDEARGKLEALKLNTTTLLSNGKTETKLLLLTGLQESKISHDEVEKYKAESPEFVTQLLSNRIARVNTKPSAGQQSNESSSEAGVDPVFVGGVADMLKRTTGVTVK